MSEIRNKLIALQDTQYKAFTAKLIPNIDPDTIIGVRTPLLRRIAKNVLNTADADEFINVLPHTYYEENNLHGFLICEIKDFDECVEKLCEFLPFVDNWATCDGMRPRCFRDNTDRLLPQIDSWLNSNHTYTVRFGIEMLMTYYLDEKFDAEVLERVAGIKSEEYYVNMMLAWFFATALAKQWDSAVRYLEENRLSVWVHNKTVQKAVESFRVTQEQKAYLKTLRREAKTVSLNKN